MHRRFLKSFATVMGAAALIMAPMAVSAQAAVIQPDDEVGFSAEANQVEFWVDYLEEERGITGATCYKIDEVDEAEFTLPPAPKDTKYVLVVTKAGADEDSANWVYFDPKEGDTVTAVDDKDISHVIWCTVPDKKTTPPVTTPPVVDTDRVDTAGAGANLGLVGAAAALLVGAGAIVLGRRRQGAHR